jgi:hypothetical protein
LEQGALEQQVAQLQMVLILYFQVSLLLEAVMVAKMRLAQLEGRVAVAGMERLLAEQELRDREMLEALRQNHRHIAILAGVVVLVVWEILVLMVHRLASLVDMGVMVGLERLLQLLAQDCFWLAAVVAALTGHQAHLN